MRAFVFLVRADGLESGMEGDNGSLIDLNMESLRRLIDENIQLVGERWLARRLKKDDEERAAARDRNHRKLRVRQQARHPLVQWYQEYVSAGRGGADDALPGASVVLLATFLSNLGKAKECDGFGDVLARLLVPDEFDAAAFEVEVAVGYLNRGWQVRFIETGDKRSPDLEVVRDDGVTFWAECKCKDGMTERDLANEAFFDSVMTRLYKVWGPSKQNLGLQIAFANDPARGELDDLCELAFALGRQMLGDVPGDREPLLACTVPGRHTVHLHYLADADVTMPFARIDYGGERSEFMFERLETLFLGPQMRNPKVFDFRCMVPPDKYQSAINLFGSAVGQIPETGPGVIWIRVPFPNGYTRAGEDMDSMATRIERELAGGQNRRVNAVIFSARWFSHEPNGGAEAISYLHAARAVTHTQPRSEL